MNRSAAIEYPLTWNGVGNLVLSNPLSSLAAGGVRRTGKIMSVKADKTAGPATLVNVRLVDVRFGEVLLEVLNEPFPLRWNPVPIRYSDIEDEANFEMEVWTDDGTFSTNIDTRVILEHP